MENQTSNANNGRKRQRTSRVKFAANIDDANREEHGPEPNQEQKQNASDATECNFLRPPQTKDAHNFGYSSLLHLLQTIPIFPHLHNQFGPALLCVNLFMKFFLHL